MLLNKLLWYFRDLAYGTLNEFQRNSKENYHLLFYKNVLNYNYSPIIYK